MKKPWEIRRRTFLGGAATALGLPVLEIMGPSIRRAQAAGAPPPRRFVTFGFPAGVNHAAWDVSSTGSAYTLSPTLAPLAALKSDFSVLMGVNNNPAAGPRGHTCGIGAFLTCKRIPMTDPAVTESISADQVAANALKAYTRIPSIELSTSSLHEVPNSEAGFSPAYKNVVSWRDPTTSLPFETIPQAAFDRLFTGVDPTASAADAQKRAKYRQSVLDSVKTDLSALQAKASGPDRVKLDQYFTSLRDLEAQIQSNPTTAGGAGTCTPGTRPAAGKPADIRDHVTQMLDIMVLAMQCDVTRVLTFFYENTVTGIRHDFLGVNTDYHGSVTHHGGDATKLAQYATVNNWIVSQLGYLLTNMKKHTDLDGNTLLDNSAVFFSSELSDGDAHSHDNLPIILAGRGGGTLNPGRAVRYTNAKIANLFISLLATVGVPVSKFGDDGDGPLASL